MLMKLGNRVEFVSVHPKEKKVGCLRRKVTYGETATKVDLALDRDNEILRIVSTEKPT
jgi:hypothetical protein